jgi:hypothetical protein
MRADQQFAHDDSPRVLVEPRMRRVPKTLRYTHVPRRTRDPPNLITVVGRMLGDTRDAEVTHFDVPGLVNQSIFGL